MQLVPFLEYLAQQRRPASRTGPGTADFWLPFYLAWTAISPDLFGNPAHGTWWDTWTNYNEANSYTGILPLLLAPLPCWRRIAGSARLAGFLLAGGIVAAGRSLPLAGHLRRGDGAAAAARRPTSG